MRTLFWWLLEEWKIYLTGVGVGGHFQNISDHRSGFVSNLPVVFHPSCCGLTRISKKGVITQKDYRGWIPVVYCNLHFKKSNMREVRRALWWIQISISVIALKKKTRSLVLNGHETFFLLRKRIYRSKSQAIICKSRPYDSFTAFLHHNITLNSHPWLLVWYSEPLSGRL